MNEQVSAFQASSPKLSKGRRKLAFFLRIERYPCRASR
jgi:hypothetical protein